MLPHPISNLKRASILKLVIIFIISLCIEQTNFVNGLQSSVLADLKQIDRASASHIPHKVKRAQEVVMFGNQQNRLSDHNYVRADKRDFTDLPNLPVTVDEQNNPEKDEIEEPIAMASIDRSSIYSQLPPLQGRYYYEQPDIYDNSYQEERQNRNMMKRSAVKRSDRVFRSFPDESNRFKRDDSQLSQLDPEELLSLLAMWEEEQHQQHRKHSGWRGSSNNDRSKYEPYSSDILNELEVNDNAPNEEWLNAPEPIHHYNVKPRFYQPYNSFIPSRQNENHQATVDHGFPQRRYL